MNPLEFDDRLPHSYLYPLDNFVDASPRRGTGRLFRIATAKSEYGLQAAVLHDPGKLVLGSAYINFETIVVGHLHHLIERLHRDALQRGLQVKTLPGKLRRQKTQSRSASRTRRSSMSAFSAFGPRNQE
jgi:hypothetical protein